MPPKPKFTREEIVAAALKAVSQSGISALTAKSQGNALMLTQDITAMMMLLKSNAAGNQNQYENGESL